MMLLWAWILGAGVFILQDGVASWLYYPKEGWKNHLARFARMGWGIFLIIASSLELGGKL